MASTELRAAAQQALEALEGGADSWQRVGPAIDALKAALAEPVQQGCDHCNHPLYAAVKCRVCGRVTEPVQEPVQEALTIERLRDALVGSRIVPPAAVEDPDGYDDGVTLHRIEALHRRLA